MDIKNYNKFGIKLWSYYDSQRIDRYMRFFIFLCYIALPMSILMSIHLLLGTSYGALMLTWRHLTHQQIEYIRLKDE